MTLKQKLMVALLAFSAVPMTLTASLAQAQVQGSNLQRLAPARVDSFSVIQLNRVGPGSELEFTLSGTPGAEITLQISGATTNVAMTEVRPGHYSGSYTVRARDRVTAASLVTARMAKDGQDVSAALDQSLVAGARSPVEALPRIASFNVTAPERVRPGDELKFSMTGAPGGKAHAIVKGVDDRIALTEESRGVYQGTYTVRRQDHLDNAIAATGFLMVNNHESSQRFQHETAAPLDSRRHERTNDVRPIAACTNCGVIEAVELVEPTGDTHNVIGTVAGGVLGGVLGHQVGGGKGKDLATIAGALGGAYAGNRVENNMAKPAEYHISVRLENSTVQTFNYKSDPGFKVGARVRVENNSIVRL